MMMMSMMTTNMVVVVVLSVFDGNAVVSEDEEVYDNKDF